VLYQLFYEHNTLNYDYQYVEGFRTVFNFQYMLPIDEEQLPDFLIGWNDFEYFKHAGIRGN
tara:strand:+ start:767 stop:949 length:183 start_codon:yes stop_codon:yes gene_type:complete